MQVDIYPQIAAWGR